MRPKLSKLPLPVIQVAMGLIVIVAAGVTYSAWWPPLSTWIDATLSSQRGGEVAGSEVAGDHGHASHSAGGAAEVTSLELTPQARMNLGLTPKFLRPVELSNYRRSITVPAVVVAKPGRSSIVVSSPLNGVVTHVHAVTGEAVTPGDLLFEVRLTYEDLVETQTAYLKTISELEVENREIARLEDATRSGAISGKQLLERRYAKEKLEAFAKSQREALRLHGLSDRQIDAIARDGKLMGDLQIMAPDVDSHSEDEELHLSQVSLRPVSYTKPLLMPQDVGGNRSNKKLLVVDDLSVHKGQAITAGDKLCSLSDYTQLFIEGKAFENDIAAISNAAQQGWKVDAVFSGSMGQEVVRGLKLVFVSNSIDSDSRTLSLFVELPNQMMRDVTNDEGQRFVSWKYRIGQRLELRVPVEQWENQIVLPVEAVVKEGADWFVFQQNGKTFTRVPVHVRHRGQDVVVIANDGSIFPGDVIAQKAAHQMQMAIKNKSGGGADPHAGHSH
ncbi:efflux RND transporter periplasmic adaptor subunit [Novipirellula caenicola]|uniref:HlyD family secretion protein n=1 Tax=Novipirellula caenicola TaxID=1536901 RepID=A0ABP9VTM8_9BACT